jgi:hypothetical protein
MNELGFLKQYTDAAKDSTSRTRHILLVMIVASILMFAAAWNSRLSGWGNSRLKFARATEDILNHVEAVSEPGWELKIPRDDADVYQKANESLAESRRTLYQARQTLFWNQQIRAEQVGHIQAPVLGINFDVNDLGMVGGITLIVLLIWAYYSLWHHANNLKLALDFAKEIGDNDLDEQGRNRLLYHTYQNLAMSQVFTIPPRPKTTRETQAPERFRRFLRKASKGLYTLPCLVLAAIVWHDWVTRKAGLRVNPRGTTIVLASGTGCLCVVVILTIMCFVLWRRINRTWETTAKGI